MDKQDTTMFEERRNAAQAWCFQNSISKEQMDEAWKNAQSRNNPIVLQLVRSKCTWMDLNHIVLKQLLDKYGTNEVSHV